MNLNISVNTIPKLLTLMRNNQYLSNTLRMRKVKISRENVHGQ